MVVFFAITYFICKQFVSTHNMSDVYYPKFDMSF